MTAVAARARELFARERQRGLRGADRVMAVVMATQWAAGVILALALPGPHLWSHVAAITLLSGAPIALALAAPGRALSRHVIAIGQMLTSGLLVHLTGRGETQFHVFASLAFLALHRDWPVLVTASVVAVVDEAFGRAFLFGGGAETPWGAVELTAWLVFADALLIRSCVWSVGRLRRSTRWRAELETANAALEREGQERRRTEDALRDSEARYRSILEMTQEWIWTTDAEVRCTFSNRACEALLGFTPEELYGRDTGELIHEEDREAVAAVLARHVAERSPWTGLVIRWRHKDGAYRWLESNGRAVFDDAGVLVGFTGSDRDVTERVRTEELSRARDAAVEASRLKSEFLAAMSHEIRTPMNGVIGMTGLLLDTELSGEQREYAEAARRSAEGLMAIIDEVLDFSKIEAGKLALEPAPFNLRLVVEDVVAALAPQAQQKGIELLVRYSAVPPRVVGDAVRIRQVLTNLAGNAVKFTHDGHVILSVECERVEGDRARLRLAVEDTGIGIPEDKLDYIFEKFTQADASTTRRHGGTGLGLAICRSLVSLMGGAIAVRSRVGAGSTFTVSVSLPIAECDTCAPPDADLEGVRVLVAKRNETARRAVYDQVAGWGMRGATAGSAAECLALLLAGHAAGRPYDVAVLDGAMEGMDGGELVRRIKGDPALRDTVLVVLASLEARGWARELTREGLAVWLLKPVRPTQLFETLAAACSRHRQRMAPRPGEAAAAVPGSEAAAHVLLAEDNPVNQTVAAKMLEKLGCRVEIAADGKEAVRMAAERRYDLILMDCEMPDMDGYQAVGEIRRNAGPSQGARVVALTAHAMGGDRARCIAAGMDDFLTKPVKPAELTAALRKAVPVRAGAAAPSRRPVPEVLPGLTDMSGDPAFLQETYDIFLRSTRDGLAGLRAAVSASDGRAVAAAAHALRGGCAAVGAGAMEAICRRLEAAAGSGSPAGWAALIDALEAERDRIQTEVEGRREATA